MSITQRPGVYSTYQVTSVLASSGGAKAVGVAASALSGTAGEAKEIGSYAEAVTAYGAASNMAALIRVLLANGAPKIVAVPTVTSGTADVSDYTAAFAKLMEREEVRYMVCDSRDASVHAALKTAITTSEREGCKYRVGIVEASGTAAQVVSAAAAINCERIAMAAPVESEGTPGSAAAALAGCVASQSDPALPYNGAELQGLGELASAFTDTEVESLITGGVTPLERAGGGVCVVRAVTTRTTTSGVADITWRELNTVLIVDDVIPDIRADLKRMFSRAKNTAQTRGAIRTQVVIALEQKLAGGVIESYGPVTAQADSSDPTICNVSFEFTVAHGLSRISLVAYITV